jgi:protein TonB
MFEDSTFESAGRIKTKTRSWMVVTFITNGFILLLPIVIPLISPEALPKAAMRMALVAPPPPPAPPPPAIAHMVRVPPGVRQSGVRRRSEMMNYQLIAPTRIPHDIKMVTEKEAPPSSFGVADMEGLGGIPGGVAGGIPGGVVGGIFGSSKTIKVKSATPKPSTPKKVTISAGVMEGYLIQKTIPIYPPIARAGRVTGTVVLQATISKTGTIENLHVVSGPSMLQSAAVDAVKTWRYRPYLLNNVPVEVETRVNVIFILGE